MMANIHLLLVATFHVAPIWSRYLLVQLEDTNGPLIEPPGTIDGASNGKRCS